MGVMEMIATVFGIVGEDAPADPMQGYRADIRAEDVRVVDGDTITYGGSPIRLMGYDTPETFEPGCGYELRLGQAATRRLEELVESGAPLALVMSDRRDRYGRHLGRLHVAGRDVGGLMIGEGLARAYDGGPRAPWCNGAGEGTP